MRTIILFVLLDQPGLARTFGPEDEVISALLAYFPRGKIDFIKGHQAPLTGIHRDINQR
jgi:hypothetical protein